MRPWGRQIIISIMARPKMSMRAPENSRSSSGRPMNRKALTSTPSWLPPERMTTAKMMTDSMKLKDSGAMVVILAA